MSKFVQLDPTNMVKEPSEFLVGGMSAVSMVLASMVKIEKFSPMGFAMDTPMAFAIPWVFP